jgi:hypothetical protein
MEALADHHQRPYLHHHHLHPYLLQQLPMALLSFLTIHY